MNKPRKIFLGLVSLMPLIILAAYLFSFTGLFLSPMSVQGPQHGPPVILIENVLSSISILALFGFAMALLLIYYTVHIFSNGFLDSNARLVWLALFLVAGVITFPIYWYLRVWKS